MATLKVTAMPSGGHGLTNLTYVGPNEFPPNIHYVSLNRMFVFSVQPLPRDESNPTRFDGQFFTNSFQRKWANIDLNKYVTVAPFTPTFFLERIILDIDYRRSDDSDGHPLDSEKLKRAFLSSYEGHIFCAGQKLIFAYQNTNFVVSIKGIQSYDMSLVKNIPNNPADAGVAIDYGVLGSESMVEFDITVGSAVRLIGADGKIEHETHIDILRDDIDLMNLGIGGLEQEFAAIFRRAFASRRFPPEIVAKLGIQHVKGLLLYGPPGTGKTLMARQIGKMLNGNEPKVVSGPEILSKFVGQSEENVRKLFAEAEAEYKKEGDRSQLHIIILDELDAICKQRGSRSDNTGVGDSIVNQLLAKMDGVDQLNNILVIGMTNRKEMIDEALLRPGRFEVHMEVGLPDEDGRREILKIHTSKMMENSLLGPDVDIDKLANQTRNYSGAELSGVVKAASSYAFSRHIDMTNNAAVTADADTIKVNMEDFLAALEEVQPAFGVSETEMNQMVKNDIWHFNMSTGRIIEDGGLFVKQVSHSKRTPLVSLLLHGPPDSGKSALAARIALNSNFPFIKLISADSMIGMTENAKINRINKVFEDAYRSTFSVVVIDNIERLLDYVSVGTRFSNATLQALLILLKRSPPKDRRLLVIGTTSEKAILDEMGVTSAFTVDKNVPAIQSLPELFKATRELDLFSPQEEKLVGARLEPLKSRLSIGIKKLLVVAEMAKQAADDEMTESTNKCDEFVQAVYQVCGTTEVGPGRLALGYDDQDDFLSSYTRDPSSISGPDRPALAWQNDNPSRRLQ
ncbi:AAA-domain-containing protein [Hesseltinella vesiculosa]|uniref:Vesicular-fusion protein SEC18 n=1 Tax=Hesseltinella vesiculosa TaxID=101127 RepID=A0A1X2GY04_9FUNG|nr:AAA-domain-containing protein [Hesseltinella vesiculosa]